MLFPQRFLDALADGRADLAFRRWTKPSARAGGRQRTAVGVVEFVSVEVIAPSSIDFEAARRAGYASRAALLAELERRSGEVYRIQVRLVGADPRLALRDQKPTPAELGDIRDRLARFDSASTHGAWALAVLRLIAECPGEPAARLAERRGRETRLFKVDVRKLKELGLTESLAVGYRLSPRGEAVLAALG
ncbi:hypothetical protein NLX83_16030 [Allokutzneria sp. A3M-2-11 16]|uniref:hypothetical protein n=1 Tax=Allokutzneria sp. A3M-2-11 16 TaxID=2962043 RepID=UPI0020B8E4D4|nr:hypothetical protein [Allokutzneria sp. A3M-2-11 16]MCP3800775.1 hypothetical protein [Allokutzneria sp. A3M-2-11 16]